MNILAIDFATTTGFAFGDGQAMHSGFVCFKAKGKQSKDQRLISFRNWLHDHARDVDGIAYEAVRSMKSANAVVALAEMQSVLKMFALEHDIPLFPYSASQIKKHITGKGNASKDDVIEAVNARFNLSIKDNNEADSIAILSLHNHQ